MVHEDLEIIERLIKAVSVADGHAPIGEHKSLTRARHHELPGLVGYEGDEAVVYVAVQEWGEGGWGAEVAIHPLHRLPAVFGVVIGETWELISQQGGRTLSVWTFHPELAEALVARGFEPDRELRQLRRSLPVGETFDWPASFYLDHFFVGKDEAGWLAVNNAAFARHRENGGWTEAILADRTSQPWFDPDGLLTVRGPDGLAGFCWTKRHDESLGEIYVVAVAPRHQRKGLGRALVLAGLDHLAEAGAGTAFLYVDADNRQANNLYTDLGFRLHHIDRAFRRSM